MKNSITKQNSAGAKGFAHAIVMPLAIFIALAVFNTTREWSLVGAMTYVVFAAFIYGIRRNRNPMDEEASVFFNFATIYAALLAVIVLALILGYVA